MNKKIKFFIIFSVMLNVLFFGLLSGFALKHNRLFEHEPPITAILAKAPISEDRRLFLENQLNEIFENSRASHKEMDKMRDETFKILTAETFDEVAYQTQMDKMIQDRSEDRRNVSEAIKNLAKQLDSKERLALAEVLKGMQQHKH